jgi:predicted ArsR family transcriptional regulator
MEAEERRHRALASPVRISLLDALRAHGPMEVQRLASLTERHPNTVRSHLEILERAGLVDHQPGVPAGPGRPGVRYRAVDTGEDLDAIALLTCVLADDAPLDRAERAAHRWGERLVDEYMGASRAAALDTLAVLLERLGFDPRVALGHRIVVETYRCPFGVLDGDRRPVACAVHRGIVRGALAGLGGRLALASLEPPDGPGPCSAVLTTVAPR